MARTRNTKSTLLFLNENTVKVKKNIYIHTRLKNCRQPHLHLCILLDFLPHLLALPGKQHKLISLFVLSQFDFLASFLCPNRVALFPKKGKQPLHQRSDSFPESTLAPCEESVPSGAGSGTCNATSSQATSSSCYGKALWSWSCWMNGKKKKIVITKTGKSLGKSEGPRSGST